MKKLLTLVSALSLAVSIPTVSSAATTQQNMKMEDLAIYYGYPSYVNGANGNVTKAVEAFKPFEVIVLGDTVEFPSHDDYSNSKQMIAKLIANKNKVFGYVPIATANGGDNLSITEMKKRIDQWKTMGATGIFMDEYGYDYEVTRAKQNELVQYTHDKGMHVFANAWVPADAMGDKDENGKAAKMLLDSNDYFLMEDFIEDQGKVQSASEWIKKADSAQELSDKTGVKVAVLSTTADPEKNNVNYSNFKVVSNASAMYGFDAFQWTEIHHSSSSNKLKVYPTPSDYGTKFIDSKVNRTSDLKTLTRKTDTGTFRVNPGVSGEFTGQGQTPTTPAPAPTPQPPSTDLQKQIDTLKAENEKLAAENAKLKEKLSAIKNVVNDFVAKINSILN